MKWFGQTWHAPVNAINDECPTPIGELCAHCALPFVLGDQGFAMPYMSTEATDPPTLFYHRDCLMQMILAPQFRSRRL